jgi:hypothetical protein
MHPDAAGSSVAEASAETSPAESMPPEAVAHLFKTCSASEMKKEVTIRYPDLFIPADIGAILEKACVNHDKYKRKFINDIGEMWPKGHLPATLTPTVLSSGLRGLEFDKNGLISAVFCLLVSTQVSDKTMRDLKKIVEKSVESHNYGYSVNSIFLPFLMALQNPQLRELYKSIRSKIFNQLLINSSEAYGNNNSRIEHMLDTSVALFTSTKVRGKNKIMVMLFAATCSELELKVWQMMQRGESPALMNTSDLNDCLLIDMGLSPRIAKNIPIIKAIDAQQKNEKLQEAARRVENFFQAIGVKVNDF